MIEEAFAAVYSSIVCCYSMSFMALDWAMRRLILDPYIV